MERLLLKTQLAFDNCKEHLDSSNTWGSEIESYLTQHILIVMCADVQQEIYKVVERRVDLADDAALKSFATASCKRVLRSVGKKEVAGFVGHFGADAKNHLNSKVNDEVEALYSNALANRHDVAHSSGANITFRELEAAIEAAKKIIAAVSEAISLNAEVA